LAVCEDADVEPIERRLERGRRGRGGEGERGRD
jgi:hypothetical protein